MNIKGLDLTPICHHVEFDEGKIDRIVSDVRDEAHLNARRATQRNYE
jgi:hypothetical protein